MHKVWKNLSREEAALRSKPVLDAIPFVPAPEADNEQQPDISDGQLPAGVPAPKPKRYCKACQSLGLSLSRIQHKVMEAICEKPDEEIRDRCEGLRILRSMECSGRRALGTFGLIEYIGSLGNRRFFFAPTKGLGERWREAHGLPRWSGHGGPIHAFMVTKSEQKFTIACPGIKFTRRKTGEPAGVRPDSLGISPGPECWQVALQVTVANKPKAEAFRLLKLCGVRKCSRNQGPPAGIGLVVVSIAVNKRVQKSIKRAVRELNNGEIPSNLVLFNAEQHLLNPSFDWSILMEREI